MDVIVMLGHRDAVRLDELAGGQECAAAALGAGGDGRGGHARVGLARGAEFGADGEGKDVAGRVQAQRGDAIGQAATEDLSAVPKLVSRVPLALNRASAPWIGANLIWPCLAEPATKIFPSG